MEKQKAEEVIPYSPARVGWGWLITFFLGWSLGGMLAGIIGVIGLWIALGLYGDIYVRIGGPDLLPYKAILLAIGVFVCGAIVGYIQWKWALRFMVSKRAWRWASILLMFTFGGTFIGFQYVFGGLYACSAVDYEAISCILSPYWLIKFPLMSLLYGLAISLPHWWVLRSNTIRAYWWIAANVLAFVLYYAIKLFLYEHNRIWPFGTVILGGFLYGIITSGTLYIIARGEKQKRKIAPAQ